MPFPSRFAPSGPIVRSPSAVKRISIPKRCLPERKKKGITDRPETVSCKKECETRLSQESSSLSFDGKGRSGGLHHPHIILSTRPCQNLPGIVTSYHRLIFVLMSTKNVCPPHEHRSILRETPSRSKVRHPPPLYKDPSGMATFSRKS